MLERVDMSFLFGQFKEVCFFPVIEATLSLFVLLFYRLLMFVTVPRLVFKPVM